MNFIGPLGPGNTFELSKMDLTSAKTVSKIYYPADMFTTVKWQDGSSLSAADFVMAMIMTFDRAKPYSDIYDSAAVDQFQSFMQSFKGVKIDSVNPLVIETWSDTYTADAELDITTWWPSKPSYGYGEAGWDILAVANLAEANDELAYTADKSVADGVDETNFVSGASLTILNNYLNQAIADTYIPYSPTLGNYISAQDAATRYANLQAWYRAHNHFWVGTGPYYLDSVNISGETLVLKSYSAYPDLSNRWDALTQPKIASVSVDGPDQVLAGDTPTFDVSVNFQGNPYPNDQISSVKYLFFDASGDMVLSGSASPVSDGKFQVSLSETSVGLLKNGTSRIEIVVAVSPVVISTFASFTFHKGDTVLILGSTGVSGVTLSYFDGTDKTATSASDGSYSFSVPYNWTGTVTPSEAGYTFTPTDNSYTSITTDQKDQDFSAVVAPTFADVVPIAWYWHLTCSF